MKQKILVVDDNPKNLQVVAALLNENNYQVEVATSGKIALLWLNTNKFDAILLDVMMPEMDGFETCKRIKKNPVNESTPIIFLTARHDIDGLTDGFKVGGVDYITKPFNQDELLARLSTHIELKLAREKLSKVNQWLAQEVDKKTKALRLANDELEKANAELRKLDDAKNDFLKSISHEIRTPLNGICGALTLIRDYSEEVFFKEVVDLLDKSVTNLERYSYAALQIANLQLKGNQQLGFMEFDLRALLKSCVNNSQEHAQNNNIHLEFRTQCEDAKVVGDMSYLQDAINALLMSALTFTHKGEIIVSLQEHQEHFALRIEDTGSLFANKEIKHYFDSLNNQNYQFERNNAMELYLAKIIIQLHKGSIQYNNKDNGSGTVTKIIIPKTI